MRPLVTTNDPVLLSHIKSLVESEGIGAFVFDEHMSMMEGSIGAFARRLMVSEDDFARAVRMLDDAGLGRWITREGGA